MNVSTAPFSLTNDESAVEPGEFPQVIRRDLPTDASGKPRVVPWLGHKISRAVSAACVAQGVEESIGQQVQAQIEFKMRRERPSFIHIEQLQDLVEETLIQIGQPHVALTYGKYRARREAERKLGGTVADDSGHQLELATRAQLADIRARISFAKIGLTPSLPDDEVLTRLLRSTSINLSPLNAATPSS